VPDMDFTWTERRSCGDVRSQKILTHFNRWSRMANPMHRLLSCQLIAGGCDRRIGRLYGRFRRVRFLGMQTGQKYLADELDMRFAKNFVVVCVDLMAFNAAFATR
jgi:hypothetical protein